MILAEAGFTDVTVASSAENALNTIAAQAKPFECFLLDIQMPGASGVELCSDIRKLPGYQKTPTIMLTAMHERAFIDDAFAAGATDYVTKPFDTAEVGARVRVAKLLVDEQRQVRDLLNKAVQSHDASTTEADFAVRLELGGVKGLVSTQAFENYLGQLSRAGSRSLTFFAVHVQGGRAIFDRSASSEFEYALHHVADATIASHQRGAVIMCYVGSGNFICSSTTATMQTTELLEGDIQDLLDEKDLTYDDGSPLDTEVVVGANVQPLLTEPLRMALLELQTIKRAMARVREKNAEPKPLNKRCFSL